MICIVTMFNLCVMVYFISFSPKLVKLTILDYIIKVSKKMSELKNIYNEEYSDYSINNLIINNEDTEDSIAMPTGWSFICLNETINYYTENTNKFFNSTN
uniref:Uncharacterized protein n=1 Tax=Pleurostichidium falkenbergii TaxID=121064 RepID=A0A4D6UYL9_9FLOR|nr:hypothetical protein [Pleurostichidium falkenbergii]QCH39634.1 hypothetical protein [Pleurostichidium falkenbergii]